MPIIPRLLSHGNVRMTSHYRHLEDREIEAASEWVENPYTRSWLGRTIVQRHLLLTLFQLPLLGHCCSAHYNLAPADDSQAPIRSADLRHSWASLTAMKDMDMVTVAKLVGHTLVAATGCYTHFSDQPIRNNPARDVA